MSKEKQSKKTNWEDVIKASVKNNPKPKKNNVMKMTDTNIVSKIIFATGAFVELNFEGLTYTDAIYELKAMGFSQVFKTGAKDMVEIFEKHEPINTACQTQLTFDNKGFFKEKVLFNLSNIKC